MVVVADPHGGQQAGCVADEPGVVLVVGGAGLAGHRPVEDLDTLAGAALHDALEHAGDEVCGLCRQDLRGVQLRGLDQVAAGVLDARDEDGLGHAAGVGEGRVGGGQLERRYLGGAEADREVVADRPAEAEAPNVVDYGADAEVLHDTHGDHIARLLECLSQRGRPVELAAVVLRSPDLVVVDELDRRVHDDAGGCVAVVERGCVHQRLER